MQRIFPAIPFLCEHVLQTPSHRRDRVERLRDRNRGHFLRVSALRFSRNERFEVCNNRPEMKRKKNPKPVGLRIKDLIVAMDQGGVKHCQRGTLKQRDHNKNVQAACLLQLFSAYVTKCAAKNFSAFLVRPK